MQKILKLTGVSILAIVAAANANAAGYTCEELIEYTSCNAGYYFVKFSTECPDGYTLRASMCIDAVEDFPTFNVSESECTQYNEENEYYSNVCVRSSVVGSDDYITDDDFTQPIGAEKSDCLLCPAGSYCAGGDVAVAIAKPCTEGWYCSKEGLTAPEAQCTTGTFSFAGATSCSICPAHVVKNSDGEYISVAATTDGLGATGFSACYIDSEVYFEDDKGKYHFNQKCSFNDGDEYGMAFYKSADGTCMDGYMYGESANEYEEDGETYLTGCFALPSSEEDCMNADYSGGEVYWDGKQCICPHGFAIEMTGDLRC